MIDLFATTEKLVIGNWTLRQLMQKDAEGICEIYSKEGLLFQPMKPISSLQEAKDYIKTCLVKQAKGDMIRFAITDQDDQMIGVFSFNGYHAYHHSLSMGAMLAPSYWKKGIMTDVMRGVIRYLEDHTDIRRIEVTINPSNTPSLKLAEKVGFEKEGIKRDAVFNQETGLFENRVLMSYIIKHR